MVLSPKKTRLKIFSQNFAACLNTWKNAGETRRSDDDFIEALDAVTGKSNSISKTTLSSWRNSRSYPQPEILACVCAVLGVTEEQLNTPGTAAVTDEKHKRAAAADYDSLAADYGIYPEFMKLFLIRSGSAYQPHGIIQYSPETDAYSRTAPDLPGNDTDDLLSDIELSALRRLTSADYRDIKQIQDSMEVYMDLLITKHNAVLSDQLARVNQAYSRKGKKLTKTEGLAIVPDNEQIKKEYEEKEKELRGKYGKCKKD